MKNVMCWGTRTRVWIGFLAAIGLLMICCVATSSAWAATDQKRYVVGVLEHWPPYYLTDSKTHQPAGFAIDIFESIGKKANIDFEYKVYPSWPGLSEAMGRGEVDILPNTGITTERENIYRFSVPYETFHIHTFVRRSNYQIKGLDDLIEVPVGVVSGNKGLYIMRNRGYSNLYVYESIEEAFLALLAGSVDALIYPEPPLRRLAIESGLENKIKVVGEPIIEIKRGVAVAKMNGEVLTLINQQLRILIGSPEYKMIYQKWFGKPVPFWNVKRTLSVAVGTAALVIFLLILIHYRLLSRVNKQLRAEIKSRKTFEDDLKQLNKQLDETVNERTLELEVIISEKEQLLEHARQRDHQIRQVMVNTQSLIFMQDLKGSYIYLNGSSLIDQEDDQFLGKTPRDLFPGYQADEFEKRFQAVIENQRPETFESELNWKGEILYTINEIAPVFDERNQLVAVSSFCHNITELRKSTERLKESEKKYKDLTELLPECVFESDINLRLTYLNRKAFELFGYTEEDFENGINGADMLAPESRDAALNNVKRIVSGEELGIQEYSGKRKDGTTFPILMRVQPVFMDGVTAGFRGVIVDNSERKANEERLRQNLKEKEILLQEIHHRVKNNLTIVSSLLGLQMKNIENPQTIEALRDSKNRVIAMASIHEALYKTEDLSYINLGAYIRDLARVIVRNYTVGNSVDLDVHAEDIRIGVRQASPVGLVINELLTNSYKYAFPDDRKAKILITLKKKDDQVVLSYRDNGIGLPSNEEAGSDNTLGFNLIKILVENQLEGTLEINSENGAAFTVIFQQSED